MLKAWLNTLLDGLIFFSSLWTSNSFLTIGRFFCTICGDTSGFLQRTYIVEENTI